MKYARWYGLAMVCSLLASCGASQDSCEHLSGVKIPGATITLAQKVAAGFAAPPSPISRVDPSTVSELYRSRRAFCRIAAAAKPTPDSNISIEVWMPVSGWNGKLQGIGDDGFAGSIDYRQLVTAVNHGYAATATDTGHTGSPIDAAWALGHPERVVDYGHRGVHEMTRVAKAVVQAFYARAPQHSYFAGCSDGGREGMMEAQRYPEDYDGILAGAPANHWTRLLSMAAADTQALTLDPASFVWPSKIRAIAAAVNNACDELDGVRDGILNDPRKCHFDPGTIACKVGKDSDNCLTARQVVALKKIYAGLHDSHGQGIYPGYLPGAEDGDNGWALWITGPGPAKSLMALFAYEYFANMVYEKPDWHYEAFALYPGLKEAEQKTANALNATETDLRLFKARGGKLILYHGWDDPAIPALNTVKYYEDVLAKIGQRDVDSFLRLYMVSGMQHCGGGPGPDSFGQMGSMNFDDPEHSIVASLEQWVEKGTAPSRIVASKFDGNQTATMTRPLCPYPQIAKYTDSGNTNDAANFVCEFEKDTSSKHTRNGGN